MEEEGADGLPEAHVDEEEHFQVPVPNSPLAEGSSCMPSVKLRKDYEDCKNEWEATQCIYDILEAKIAGLVYMALTTCPDKPRDLLSHLDMSVDILQPDGLKKITRFSIMRMSSCHIARAMERNAIVRGSVSDRTRAWKTTSRISAEQGDNWSEKIWAPQ